MKLLIFSLLLSVNCYSQISKTINIGRTYNSSISAHIKYEGNIPVDSYYVFMAKDDRYKMLTDYIVIKDGSIKDIYKLLTAVKEFHSTQNDDGTSLKHDANLISIYKFMGGKWLNVYGIGTDSNGYSTFNIEQINKLIKIIDNWAKKNNVQLT